MLSLFPEREIVLQAGQFSVQWYGLLWVVSFWLIWYLVPRLQKYRELSLSQDEWTKLIVWGAVGALVGGRLGYVVFYELSYFLQNPSAIFALWEGGMASHGGVLGAVVALWGFVRFHRLDSSIKSTNDTSTLFLRLLDVLVVPAALALALGRVGNWINLEIFGANPIAIGKNLLVAAVCYWLLTRKRQDGIVLAGFLITYSVLRFVIEPLRDDPWPLVWGLTRGQLLTLPLFVLGILLALSFKSQDKSEK